MRAAAGGVSMKKTAFFVLAMGLALPAFAAGDEAAEKPKKKKEKKICMTFESSASRMGNRVCKTAAQWAAQSSRSKKSKDMEDLEGMSN
jgi:hypothetical protein